VEAEEVVLGPQAVGDPKNRELGDAKVEREHYRELVVTDGEEIRLVELHREKKRRGRGDLTLIYRKSRIVKHRWLEDEEWVGQDK
jgi:hypothetical protein